MLYRTVLTLLFINCITLCKAQNALDNHWHQAFDFRTSNLSPVDSNYAVINVNNNFGVIGIQKDTILQPIYRSVSVNIDQSWAIASKNRIYGVIDLNKNIRIPFEYYALHFRYNHFLGTLGKESIIMNSDFEETIALHQDSFYDTRLCSVGVIVSKTNSGTGIMDFNGKWIINPEYDLIREYAEGTFVLNNKKNSIIWDAVKDKRKIVEKANITFANKSGYVEGEDKTWSLHRFDSKEIVTYDKISTYGDYNTIIATKGKRQYLLGNDFNIIVSGEKIDKLYWNSPRNLNNAVFSPLYTVKGDDKLSLVMDNKVVLTGPFNYFQYDGLYIYAMSDDHIAVYDKSINLIRELDFTKGRMEASFLFEGETKDTSKVVSPSQVEFELIGGGNCHFEFPYFYKYDYKADFRYSIYDLNGRLLTKIKDSSPRIQVPQNDGQYVLTISNTGLNGWIVDNKVIQPKYLEVKFTRNGKVIAKKNHQWGIVDLQDSLLQAFTDNELVSLYNSNVYACKGKDNYNVFMSDTSFIASEVKENGSLFYYKNEDGKWHTITQNEVIIPFEIESPFKNHIVNNDFNSHMYLSVTNYETYLTFDTIYNVDYEDVGVKGDSLYYFDYYYQEKFKILGDKPLGKIGNLRYFEKGKEIFIIDDQGYPYIDRSFKNIYKTNDNKYKFYTDKNGSYEFFGDDPNESYSIKADSIKKVFADTYAIYKKGVNTWINLESNKEFVPSVDKIIGETEFNFVGLDSLLYSCLLDQNFKVISGRYENIREIKPSYFQVELNRQFGLINAKGELVVPLDDYNSTFRLLGDNLIKVEKEGLIGVYNTEEKEWLPPNKYQDIKSCNIRIPLIGDIYMFRQDGLYGIMDEACNTIFENIYKSIDAKGTFLQLQTIDNKLQIYLPQDQQMLPMKFDNMVSYWSDELKFLVRSEGKYILYKKAVKVGETDYPYIDYLFRSNRFSFRDHNGKMGILNEDFSIHLPPTYDHIDDYYGAVYKASINGKHGFINEDGEILLPLEYDMIGSESGLVYGFKNGKKYIFDRENFKIDEIGYDEIRSIGEHYILKATNQITIKDKFHNTLNIVTGDDAMPMEDEVIPIKRNDYWRLYNRNEELISDEFFRFLSSPKDGIYLVIKKGSTVYEVFSLNQKKYKVEEMLQSVSTYHKLESPEWTALKAKGITPHDSYMGVYHVVRDRKTNLFGVANVVGDILLPLEFEEIAYNYVKGFFAIYKKDGKYGIIKTDFSMTPNENDKLTYQHDGQNVVFRAQRGEQELIIDLNGNKVK